MGENTLLMEQTALQLSRVNILRPKVLSDIKLNHRSHPQAKHLQSEFEIDYSPTTTANCTLKGGLIRVLAAWNSFTTSFDLGLDL